MANMILLSAIDNGNPQSKGSDSMFCVVYRTGAAKDFDWHTTNAYPTRDWTEALAEEIRRNGYKAMVWTTREVLTNGLPKTFE